MLENVVSNRDMEVNLLGEKLDSFEASASPEATTSCKVCAKETDSLASIMNADVPTTSKCDECDYHSQDESDMKKHVQSSHECKCKVCSIFFSTELLLSEHVKKEHESTVHRSEEENQDVEKVRCPEYEYTAKSGI